MGPPKTSFSIYFMQSPGLIDCNAFCEVSRGVVLVCAGYGSYDLMWGDFGLGVWFSMFCPGVVLEDDLPIWFCVLTAYRSH